MRNENITSFTLGIIIIFLAITSNLAVLFISVYGVPRYSYGIIILISNIPGVFLLMSSVWNNRKLSAIGILII